MGFRLGDKSKRAARLGLKVAVGGAMVAGAVLGMKGKGEEKFEEKKQEVDETIAAGKVVAGAVQGIGQATAADIAANPLKAKKAAAKGKQMVVGVVAAAAKDPVGAAAQVKYATAPKTQAAVEGQYPLGKAPKKKGAVFGAEESKAACQALCYSKNPKGKGRKYNKCIKGCN